MNKFFFQSLTHSLIGYLGFCLGTFAAIFIYPLNYKFYGTIRYLFSLSEIIYPFILIGIANANVKFYHELKFKKIRHQFVSFSIFFSFFLFIFLFLIHPIFQYYFSTLFIWKYKYFLFILILFLAVNQIINHYLINLQKIIVPGIIESILPKIASLLSFLYFLLYKDYNISLIIFTFFFIISFLFYCIYLKKIDKFIFSFNFIFLKKNKFYKSLFNFGFFNFLGTLGSILTLRIDSFMIVELIDEKFNGYYATYLSILSLLSIPTIGVYNIYTPIIRDYIFKKKFIELNELYKKSSFILFFFSSFLFCIIFTTCEPLFHVIKNGKELIPYLSIIFILGISILFDIATGFSSNILIMSNYYYYNVYFMLFLSILNIILNFFFIFNAKLGIIGISYASSISLIMYNIIKFIFNYQKFKLNPLTMKMFKILFLIMISIILNVFLSRFNNYYFFLFLNPLLILILFLIGNYFFKIISLNDFKNI